MVIDMRSTLPRHGWNELWILLTFDTAQVSSAPSTSATHSRAGVTTGVLIAESRH